MQKFDYTVETKKTFDQAVSAVETKAAERGFRVLFTHNVQATLAEKGFQREPLKIVELCNARYAHQVLEKDIKTSLMLPCPISIYTEKGKTYISALKPKVIKDFYPQAEIEQLAEEVDMIITAIVDEAR